MRYTTNTPILRLSSPLVPRSPPHSLELSSWLFLFTFAFVVFSRRKIMFIEREWEKYVKEMKKGKRKNWKKSKSKTNNRKIRRRFRRGFFFNHFDDIRHTYVCKYLSFLWHWENNSKVSCVLSCAWCMVHGAWCINAFQEKNIIDEGCLQKKFIRRLYVRYSFNVRPRLCVY